MPEGGETNVNDPSVWAVVAVYGVNGFVVTNTSCRVVVCGSDWISVLMAMFIPGIVAGVNVKFLGIVPDSVATTWMPSSCVFENAPESVIDAGSSLTNDVLDGDNTICSVPDGVAAF